MKSPTNDRETLPQRPTMPAGYGISKAETGLLTWEQVGRWMTLSRNYWVSSTRQDGRPHAMPVWGVWLDDTLYFATDRNSRKARNLANYPAVSVHTESGDEVVIIEGIVEDVTDRGKFDAFTRLSSKKYPGMPAEAEPDPANVLYAVRPRIVMAWREKDFPESATRWKFGP